MDGTVGVITFVRLPADDLAAIEFENQVKGEAAAHHLRRQPVLSLRCRTTKEIDFYPRATILITMDKEEIA